MVLEDTTLWEVGFRLVRTFCLNFEQLTKIPVVKGVAFAFGTCLMFSKDYFFSKRILRKAAKIG